LNIQIPNTIQIVNLIFEYSFVLIKYAYRAYQSPYSTGWHSLLDASELIMTVPWACSATVEFGCSWQHMSSQ